MGKALDKVREFEATSRREAYKFWLGFFEKLFLLLFATIVIPFSIGQSNVPIAIAIVWVLLCAGLFIGILALGAKLSKLSTTERR